MAQPLPTSAATTESPHGAPTQKPTLVTPSPIPAPTPATPFPIIAPTPQPTPEPTARPQIPIPIGDSVLLSQLYVDLNGRAWTDNTNW